MKNLKVSICIPTYNRASLLSLAIRSAILQTYRNIEIVVSDNHSTDNTEKVVRRFKDRRLVYKKLPKTIRPIDNHNNVMDIASGSYVTILADDDLLKPTYVEKLLKLISSNKDFALARCGLEYIDQKGKFIKNWGNFPLEESARDFIYFKLMGKRASGLSGYLFRKSDFESVGGFENMGFDGALYADDFLWFKLALKNKNIVSTNEHLWSYRLHTSRLSSNLDIDKFIKNVPKYITKLEMLSKEQNLDNDLILFIRNTYSKKIISDRIRYELSKAKKSSYLVYLGIIRKNFQTIIKYLDIKTELTFLYWKLLIPYSKLKQVILDKTSQGR